MNKKIKEIAKYILRSEFLIRKYIKEIDTMYEMTPEQLRKRNEAQFLNLFRNAYKNSKFYHELYSKAGIKIDDIKSLQDIKKLPVITKEMIREHIDDMLLIPKWKTVKNHTSGTTGSPLVVYEDWPSIWREQAYFYCYRKRCGYEYGKDIIASLRGHLDRSTNYLYIGVSKTLYLSSYNLSEENVEKYYTLLKKYSPKAIEGYPSSLYNLAKILEKKGFDIQIPITFTSSETLDLNMRKYIERILHTQIFDHYGNTERTIRLEESQQHDGYYEDPGYSINEYEQDYVVTTALINTAFPLIRYRVDDIVQLKKDINKRNNVSQAIVSGINGRSTDCIVGKDGTNFSGAVLTYLAKAIPHIQIVQLVQKEKGKVEICIVPDIEFSEKDQDEIKDIVDNVFGLTNIDYVVRIISSDDLKYAKNGKLSLIVSCLK